VGDSRIHDLAAGDDEAVRAPDDARARAEHVGARVIRLGDQLAQVEAGVVARELAIEFRAGSRQAPPEERAGELIVREEARARGVVDPQVALLEQKPLEGNPPRAGEVGPSPAPVKESRRADLEVGPPPRDERHHGRATRRTASESGVGANALLLETPDEHAAMQPADADRHRAGRCRRSMQEPRRRRGRG
jgi:hypothetical protein